MTSAGKKINGYALAAILLADICSKSHPIFTKLLYRSHWTPLSIYAMTLLFIVILLGLHEFMQINGSHRWEIGREDVKGIVLTTLTGGVLSPILFILGLQYVSASDAVLISGMLPLFIVFFAVWMLGERCTRRMIAGGTLLIAGTCVLLWQDILKAQWNMGAAILILSSVTGALTTTLHKKYVSHPHLDSIVLIRSIISLCIVIILMIIIEPESLKLLRNPPSIWIVLGLSIVAFIIPYFLYFRALKHVKAMDAGIVLTAGPPVGLLLSNVFLGEQITVHHLISMTLVAAGIFFINVPLTRVRIMPMRLMAIGPLRR